MTSGGDAGRRVGKCRTTFTPAGEFVDVVSTVTVATTAEALYDFLADEANMPGLAPWWISLQIVRSEAVEAGLEVDYRMRAYGVPYSWKTRVNVMERPGCIRYH